jgi:capsular polysaccharide biosynthesis protein
MSTENQPNFLRLRAVQDAILVARPNLHDWSGGAGVLKNGEKGLEYLADSGIKRFGRDQIKAPEIPQKRAKIELDRAVFGGYLYDHYGHFLLESLARLWQPKEWPREPIVWIACWTDELSPWMVQALDILNLSPDRHVVSCDTGPFSVRELLVPDAGFEFGTFMHPLMAKRLSCVNTICDGSHVWLSRKALMPISGLDEEDKLENRMAREGWIILRPEEIDLETQVSLLSKAAHIAGLEGSAFHTLMFLQDFTGVVDLFTRQGHKNFEIVAQTFGFSQLRHTLPGATSRERKKEKGVDMQWSGVDIDALIKILSIRCSAHN